MMREQAGRLVAILKAAFPRQAMPATTVEFYVHSLSDLEHEETEAAVHRLTRRVDFIPSIAEIRREVADARLGLPDAAGAWDIALEGSLKDAPEVVRGSVNAVGGRWAIKTSENPTAVRAQFWRDYETRRERAVLEEAGAVAPRTALVSAQRDELAAGLERIVPRPVLAREIRRLAGNELPLPTEAERTDAIEILREGPHGGEPSEDMLYRGAELVFVEVDRAMREEGV